MLGIKKRAKQRILVAVLFLTFLLFGFGCSGGGGGSDDSDSGTTPPPPPAGNYIEWTDNANGPWVVDVNGDFVLFEVGTGYMVFGSTVYTNTYVDGSANIIWNSTNIGGVYAIKSTSGTKIAGLVGHNGYFIDIYGPESNLVWTYSSLQPVPASASASDAVGNEEAYSARYYQEPIYLEAETEEDSFLDDSPVVTRMVDGEALFLPLLSPENPEISEPNAFVEQNGEAQEGILY